MKIYDISKLIDETMIVYKNRDSKKMKRTVVANHIENHFHESRIELDMHCGTHIDAPLHMVDNGNTIDQMDLMKYYGICKVFDLTHVETAIYKKDIVDLSIEENDIIIFKTKNSYDTTYNSQFVYIEEDAAQYLVDKKIKTIGIDAMSVERDKKNHPTHKILLGANIGVIEDLQLKEIVEKQYLLVALPLKINQAEASPVRAILIEE